MRPQPASERRRESARIKTAKSLQQGIAASPAGNFNLPPVTRAQAEQEYRALNMPAASTDVWVDIRTNKRGFLDAHEDDLHKGHALRKHVRISELQTSRWCLIFCRNLNDQGVRNYNA